MARGARYWLALHPDRTKPIGGVKQMHRLAEGLSSLGRDVSLIQTDASFHPGWFVSNVKTVDLNRWKTIKDLTPARDIIILPETYISSFSTYAPQLPKVIYNQNGHYTFLAPKGVPKSSISGYFEQVLACYLDNPELIHVLCVSDYDSRFLVQSLGLSSSKVSIVPNSIESCFHYTPSAKKPIVAYMPRKNELDSSLLVKLIEKQPWFANYEFAAIDNMHQLDVAHILRESMVFLSFGHPEGFGLPVAEAMACGCYCIGYSGLGGRELYSIGERFEAGCSVEYGDWNGITNALRDFIVVERIDSTAQAKRQSLLSEKILALYSPSSLRSALGGALARIESRLQTFSG